MALIKETETNLGISASYWRIGYISLDRVSKYGSITIMLYINKTAKQYIDQYTELIDSEEKFNEFFSTVALAEYKDIYNSGYEFIKKYSNYFADAESDEEIDVITETNI